MKVQQLLVSLTLPVAWSRIAPTSSSRPAGLAPRTSAEGDVSGEPIAACPSTQALETRGGATAVASGKITFAEVQEALRTWCDGVIEIGQVYTENGDYRAVAIEMIEHTYAFNLDLGRGNQVLFKPTKAYEHPLRSTFDEAVSYFAGAGKYSEDKGFAIQPWSKIRFDIHGVFITNDAATAMGHYMFTDANTGLEARVEYTFQYVRGPDGRLKIVLHHSSMPYTPH